MKMRQYNLLHTPEGVRDIYNGECARKIELQNKLSGTMKNYGYKSIQTPNFEFFDIFSEERGTTQSKEMYKFIDREGNTLVLRPDMTPSIARCVAKYFKEDKDPIRLTYLGDTYTNNSSHQGKLNEITQVGAELVNDSTVIADSEILAITVDCLLQAGLKEFQVEVGHADFFNGLMEEADFNEEEIMQIKSLMECKNMFGLETLIGSKKINPELKELLMKLPELFGNPQHFSYARSMTKNEKALKALDRIEEILTLMDAYGMKDYITVDLSMLSKYDYYTGIIMKAYTYGTGEPVAQGGRYDNLVGQFGKDAPAVGLVIVIDQLMFALSRQKLWDAPKEQGILLLHRNENRELAIQVASGLRKDGHDVTVIQNEGSMIENYTEFAEKYEIGYIAAIKDDKTMCVTDLSSKEVKEVKPMEWMVRSL